MTTPADQTDQNLGTDLTTYALPDEKDFESTSAGSAKKYWRTGGRSPDYPGIHDFVARSLPAPRGRRPMVKISRHLFQLPNSQWFGILCPLEMRVPGGRCLVHEQMRDLAQGNPLDLDVVKQMEAREVDLINVILRNDEARGPVIHEANYAFAKHSKDMMAQGVNSFDPTPQGFDLAIHVPVKGSGQRWEYKNRLKPSPLSTDPQQMADWIANAPDLAAEARCLTFDQQEKAYQKALERRPPASGVAAAPAQHVQSYSSQPARQPAPAARQIAGTVAQRPPADDGPL